MNNGIIYKPMLITIKQTITNSELIDEIEK